VLGHTPAELAALAGPSSEGLHLVPAFGGLAAPWWDEEAVGLLSGLTFGSRAPHLARAALESIAFQVEDVVDAMHREVHPVQTLLADGGPTANATLMQLPADTSGRRGEVARTRELSALGVAHRAGTGAGVWTRTALEQLERPRDSYDPVEQAPSRLARTRAWHAAVDRARRRTGSREWDPAPSGVTPP
jgi:glycerol kinase